MTGRPLVAGDRIRFTYGAGPSRALAGRYAQKNARFWIAVDGDGDGAHRYLVASPGVEVRPGPAAVLLVTVPSTARPGEEVPVRIALLDARRNAGPPVRGEVTFEAIPPGVEMPSRVELEPADAGRALVSATVKAPGVYRLRARAGPLAGVSNPLVVSENGARVLWGDLHGHSASSDGTGTPGDYFRYARDVAGLDVVALTDHDHLGMLPLDEYPDLGQEIARETRRFHEPGRFVTLPGYEWTSWIYGHRHVLYFDGDGPLLSSVDPAFATPAQLWKGLAGRAALTFAHHSAGGPIATDWSIPPDPVFEPVTEIVSVHGSSEAADAPGVIHRAVDGNFVRDALAMGYRFGFIGSGDTHDGHPGVTHIGYPSGGLAAIASESLTREGVLEALRTRRVYATNGRRILLRATLGGHAMGSTIPVPGGALALRAEVAAVAPLERLDVIRSGEVVASLPAQGQLDFSVRREIGDLRPGEYLYVRAVQEDGGAAWSSPFFVE